MLKYEDCIVFNLAKAYQSAHSRMAALFKPHGLTPIQALVLQAISEQEGQSASEISKRLLLDNATLSGVLDRLADGGWVERRATRPPSAAASWSSSGPSPTTRSSVTSAWRSACSSSDC
jgi:hypothetical protein